MVGFGQKAEAAAAGLDDGSDPWAQQSMPDLSMPGLANARARLDAAQDRGRADWPAYIAAGLGVLRGSAGRQGTAAAAVRL